MSNSQNESTELPVPHRPTRQGVPDYVPKLGEWCWIILSDDETGKPLKLKDIYDEDDRKLYEKVPGTGVRGKKLQWRVLCCVEHRASNHVRFGRNVRDSGGITIRVRYEHLLRDVTPEPHWRAYLDQKITEKQKELSDAVKSLSISVRDAGLISDGSEPTSMLPALTRTDPEIHKRQLIKLRDKTLKATQETVKGITQDMVALQQDLVMPMMVEHERMSEAVEGVQERLFALKLYAGIGEGVKKIRDGKPPAPETPIAVRQMLLYMDEESLIDFDKGGMGFDDLRDFDDWISQPENLNRICPELRCIVGFQIRRDPKDYGPIADAFGLLARMEQDKQDKYTYLIIRNGEQVFRLWTDIEFRPGLLPFRDEFTRPFLEVERGWMNKPDTEREITPQDLDYDKHVKERMQKIYEYNRIMFLVQGFLDRSEVFNPHPPISLSNEDHLALYFRPIYDEQDGLPTANPPNWKEYRDKANALIRAGSYVYSDEYEERRKMYNRFGSWEKDRNSSARPRICLVKSVSRDRKKLTFRFSLGDRITAKWVIDMTRPIPDKPGWYRQKHVETNHGERFGTQTVEMENCFNVEAYTPGDYKKFLCDRHLKGAYLEWAPELLSAEKWHMEKNKPTKHVHAS